MKRISILLAGAVGIAVLSGCYTQLAVVERPRPSPRMPCPDSLSDSCGQTAERDTVYLDDDDRKICYWTRDWRGEPVLRCYRTYYSDSWVSYYSDPWWYSRYRDHYWGYNHCPSYYYYDPYTGYCRYYRDFERYYYPVGHSSGGSSGGGSRADKPEQLYRGRKRPGESTGAVYEGVSPESSTKSKSNPYTVPGGPGSPATRSSSKSSTRVSSPDDQHSRGRSGGSVEREGEAPPKSAPASSQRKQSSVREPAVQEQPQGSGSGDANERHESTEDRKRRQRTRQ